MRDGPGAPFFVWSGSERAQWVFWEFGGWIKDWCDASEFSEGCLSTIRHRIRVINQNNFLFNSVRSFVVYIIHKKVASMSVAINFCDVLAHTKRLFGVTLMIWSRQAQTTSVIEFSPLTDTMTIQKILALNSVRWFSVGFDHYPQCVTVVHYHHSLLASSNYSG